MRVVDKSALAVEMHAQMWKGMRPAAAAARLEATLKPLSRPELGDIRIEDAGLNIGRGERPFVTFGKIATTLSIEHARIYHKDGSLYVADLKSRKGTTVNRVRLGREHCKLADGDEICFGGALSYRIEMNSPARPADLRLTLTPVSEESGLEPIAIAKFPFHVGKADVMFSKYVNECVHGQEFEYLSRRHAYIFLKDGQAHVEDLGSSNGTFVDGNRIDRATPINEGAVVAFGGKHFVYRIGVTRQTVVELAVGQTRTSYEAEPAPPMDEGTQFIAAPGSFLRLLHEGDRPKEASAPGAAAVPAPIAQTPVAKRRRGRFMTLLSELRSLLAGEESDRAPRRWWWVGGAAAVFCAIALMAYVWNAPERHLKNALARGDYAEASALAGKLLERHPDDLELKARTTEAALKTNVPMWLEKIKAHDYGAANNVLIGMSDLGRRDADLAPLIGELHWLGSLEALVTSRGGLEAPIRVYADEDSIGQLIERWNNDTGEHQRALSRIASRVPQFGDWYGTALTHLRKLQSDATVYLPVVERLKASIATDLKRDDPEALQLLLKETAERYPRLGGVDSVRADLARYLEIRREVRTHQSGRLFAVLANAQFATPAFADGLRALRDSGQLPSADLVQRYAAATQAWKEGNSSAALASLLEIAQGAWAQDVAAELERRRGVLTRFAALEQSQGSPGFVDQLLAFRESLDAGEDVYYLQATSAELNQQRDKVIARAQDSMNRARTLWQEYRSNGAIDASQRIETSISEGFRREAHLLAEANRYAKQGFLIYSLVDAAGAERWAVILEEIETESSQQRSRLHELGNVVEPELLKTKLALLGEGNV